MVHKLRQIFWRGRKTPFFLDVFTVWLCQPVKIVDIYLMTCVWIGFGTTSSAIIVLTSTILCRHEFIKFAKNTMRMNVIEALLDAYNQINIFHTIDFSEFNKSQNVEIQSNIAIHFITLCISVNQCAFCILAKWNLKKHNTLALSFILLRQNWFFISSLILKCAVCWISERKISKIYVWLCSG